MLPESSVSAWTRLRRVRTYLAITITCSAAPALGQAVTTPSAVTAPGSRPSAADASAESTSDANDEVIEVEGSRPAESASSVDFGERELSHRPHMQPSDVLRQVPGLMVSQHAGGGKSDQYFLRGFDADHGTDVAVFVDGIPVNLTSHGHGQGYADSHWLIPELISTLQVNKGPYAARFGDFYTAGAIDIKTLDRVPASGVWISGGTELAGPVSFRRPTARLVGIANPQLGRGDALLAVEASSTDGPFTNQQDFNRITTFGKVHQPLAGGDLQLSGTFYAAKWNQSGQVPSAEVRAGRLDRFDSLDPTEGGDSSRWSAAAKWERGTPDDGQWLLHAYAVGYQLQLFSNFTLFSRDIDNGDQIEQGDDRLFGGGSVTYRRYHRGRLPGLFRAGVQVRGDSTTTDLWHSARRVRLVECFEKLNPCNRTDNRIWNLAAYLEEDVSVSSRVRLLAGLRADQYLWKVGDLDPMTRDTMDTTAGSANNAIISPKISAIVRASDSIEVFVNSGFGFHSNDARAAVASDGDGALARALGLETGARLAVGSSLRGSVAAWYLGLASEQVWSGDAGGTEPSDSTRRYGIDVDLAWRPSTWLALDANIAVGRSSFVANQGNGGALALSPRLMGGGGVTIENSLSFASLRLRGIDSRPANDDGSLRAEGFALLDVVAEHKIGRTSIGITIINLLNSKWREAQFAEESRVTPRAEVVEDVHFTPGAPLTAMVTIGRTL
jgi:TonB dependent receptor/TonB-dependent Receptor Plug Domain